MNNTPITKESTQQEESFLNIHDIIYLCIARWKWFVLSLAVCLGIAMYYLLKTPPTYERTASVLIKEDGKSKSVSSDVASMFSDMGLNGGKTNVYNELNAMQSPAVLLEAGKRLNYDMTYMVPGTFHKQVIYGDDLPVKVVFHDLKPEESASLVLHLKADRTFEATNVKFSGSKKKTLDDIKGKCNTTVKTELGRMTVVPTGEYNNFVKDDEPLYISRSNLYDMTNRIKGSLQANITDKNATLIDLTYDDVLPKRAEDIINMVITVYKESWMKDKNLMTIATSNFITERLGVIERELGDVDDNISSYKSTHLLPDVSQVSNLYMDQARENMTQILQLNTQRSIANYMKSYLTETSKQNQLLPANSGIESTGIESQISEYNSKLLERNSLVANSSERNPLVQDIDQALAAQRKAILASVNNLIVSIDTQIRHVEENENRTVSQIASSPNQAKYLQSVGRQQKVKEALYLFLLQKREENELSQAFTAYNTRIITPPSGSLAPIAPVRNKILMIAFAIGLLLPIGIIYLLESTNTKLRGRKDLDGVNIPFLGEIPQHLSGRKRHWWERKKKQKEDKAVLVKSGKRDITNEAFRVLRTNIEFVCNQQDRANIILLTSFNPGSGKSFLSVNIAQSFAIRNKRTLVIDFDLRHGSTSQYVSNPSKGLTDYLSGKADNVHELIVSDKLSTAADILPIGTIPPTPTELLYSDRLAPMMEMLGKQYDYIFLDCPPIEVVADTKIIEQYADRVIFVVRAGLLERSMISELQKLYDENTYKNMSLILNGTQGSAGRYGNKYGYSYRYGYGYGYGYGYHYGSKDDKKA